MIPSKRREAEARKSLPDFVDALRGVLGLEPIQATVHLPGRVRRKNESTEKRER